MKKQARFLWMVLGAAVIGFACTFSSTPIPAPPATENPLPESTTAPAGMPFEGM